jgi:hypothetical protein
MILQHRETLFFNLIKETIMQNSNATASTAHKEAAAEHQACATQHLKAAASHDSNNHEDAQASAKSALKSCETASKHSANACACSEK